MRFTTERPERRIRAGAHGRGWIACGLALAMALSACDAEPASGPGGASVADSAGVEIVLNPEDDGAPLLPVEETLRLGSLEGGGPEGFSDIRGVAVNGVGRIAVANEGSATIRVFEPDGRFVGEYGGRGEGPGEVSTADDVYAFGDTVVLVDWQRGGKVVLHAMDGALLDAWTVRQADGTAIMPMRPAGDGWLVAVRPPNSIPALSPGDSATLYNEIHRMEFGSDEVGPRVYRIPIYTLYGTGAAGERSVDWGLFRAETLSGFDERGRLFITDPESYRIDVLDADGLVRSVRRDVPLRPITDDDVDAYRGFALQAVDTMSRIPDDMRPQQRLQIADRIDRQASLPIPEVMPPLTGLLVSGDGSFWARVSDAEGFVERKAASIWGGGADFPTGETTWDLFDASGRLAGRTVLPRRFRAEAVRGDEVVGVWADELDVEYVVRYRVVRND